MGKSEKEKIEDVRLKSIEFYITCARRVHKDIKQMAENGRKMSALLKSEESKTIIKDLIRTLDKIYDELGKKLNNANGKDT